MIDEIFAYINAPPRWDEIDIVAGIDAEPLFDPNYSAPPDDSTRAWVTSFQPALAKPIYYNFGSTDGYPVPAPYVPPAGACCSPWSVDQLYEVSYGLGTAFSLPEIYKVPYSRNWHRVQKWSIESGRLFPLRFSGVTSECESSGCTQFDPTICHEPEHPQDRLACFDYTQKQAWQAHWLEINSDPLTRQNLPWSTDIRLPR
jgi:hypothetical protein